MKIITETSLENFEAWSGGADTLDTLIEMDLCERLEYHIENDIFEDGCTDTQLNDFLWFERDFIAELLGYRNWDDLEYNDEEEEEESIDFEYLEESIKNEVDFKTYCDNCCGGCDTCPFDRCATAEDCERAYNMMLNGYSFEEVLVL